MKRKQAVTKLKVDLRSISIDKSGLEKLCKIVLKAAEQDPSAYVTFIIEGKSEIIEAKSIESLVSARLPRDLSEITLRVSSSKNSRTIGLYISEIGSSFMTFSNIEVSSQDVDWVSARTNELEDFIDDHKNFHWVFQNWWSILIQVVGFSILLANSLWDTKWGTLIAMLSGYCYFLIARKIFPMVVIETGRPSTIKTIRKILIFIIPLIFLGLVADLLASLIWPS